MNLSFNDLTSIAELGGAARLNRLLVQHNKLVSLDGVDQMPQLRALRAQKNRISDLSPLRACSQLEELWVQQNSIRDIDVFARCLGDLPRLRRLVAFPNPFCPHTEGEQYDLCRSYLLTKLRSLTYLNGDLEEHEREEADAFFRTEQGRLELQSLAPAEPAKKSRSSARVLDVDDGGSSEPGFDRRRGHWLRTGSGNSGRRSPTATPAVAPATPVNRKGGSGSHFHQALPKDALLQWINGMLGLHETLDTLVSSAAICQVMDVLGRCCDRFPDCVPMHKVNFRAVLEHECVKNYKVLQEVFRRFGVAEQPNWSTLAQGRSTDLLELLRWTHRFCEDRGITASEWRAAIDGGGGGTATGGRWEHQYMLQQRDGTKYDPVRRREKALKLPLPGVAKRPSQKFTTHVAKRSGAFSQTERAAHGLYAEPDARESGSPRQRSPVWGETRAETQARAYSDIKSNATSPRRRSSSNSAQRHSHSSPSRALRSPSTGAGRARSRSRMEDARRHRAPGPPRTEHSRHEFGMVSRVAGSEEGGHQREPVQEQLNAAHSKLRKIQQLCDNTRGSSPGRENRDLEDFIASVERVLASNGTQEVPAATNYYREYTQEPLVVSPTTQADRDEIALLRAQIEAIDAKLSAKQDAASPATSVTSATSATAAPLSPKRAIKQARRVQVSMEIHAPSSIQVGRVFETHQGDDADSVVSWDGAQRASEDLFPVSTDTCQPDTFVATCVNDTVEAWRQGLAASTPFLPLLLRHAFEAADRRQSETLDREGFTTFVDATVYFYRSWDRFQFVQ